MRQEARDKLVKIKVEETDRPLFKFVSYTQEGFIIRVDGYYINLHSHHHILINGQKYKILDFLKEDPTSGTHTSPGIIIISGKNIQSNNTIKGVTMFDITPTILYLMGLPVAKDMIGKVMVQAIDTRFLKKHPLRYVETYETKDKDKEQIPIRSPIDEEKIKERMRSLGYIN